MIKFLKQSFGPNMVVAIAGDEKTNVERWSYSFYNHGLCNKLFETKGSNYKHFIYGWTNKKKFEQFVLDVAENLLYHKGVDDRKQIELAAESFKNRFETETFLMPVK